MELPYSTETGSHVRCFILRDLPDKPKSEDYETVINTKLRKDFDGNADVAGSLLFMVQTAINSATKQLQLTDSGFIPPKLGLLIDSPDNKPTINFAPSQDAILLNLRYLSNNSSSLNSERNEVMINPDGSKQTILSGKVYEVFSLKAVGETARKFYSRRYPNSVTTTYSGLSLDQIDSGDLEQFILKMQFNYAKNNKFSQPAISALEKRLEKSKPTSATPLQALG